MLTILLVLTLSLCLCSLFIKSVKLYYTAKQKHQKEWMTVHWFIGSSYGKTGINIPRALYPLFTVFNGKFAGLTCAGIRVHIQNTQNEFLLCRMESQRRSAGVEWDLGVGGVIPYNHNSDETVREELNEETSIDNEMLGSWKLTKLKVVTPATGYHCIVYNYLLEMPGEIINELRSKDGTYESFRWIGLNDLMKLAGSVRDDPFTFLAHDF